MLQRQFSASIAALAVGHFAPLNAVAVQMGKPSRTASGPAVKKGAQPRLEKLRVRVAEVIALALAVFSVSTAAQTSGPVRGGSAEPVYSVVSPIGESTVKMISMTPRPNTLAGTTVCMVSNRSFKADIALPAIEEQLKQMYPNIRIVSHTLMPVAPMPTTPDNPQKDAENLRLALEQKGCGVLIAGNGG